MKRLLKNIAMVGLGAAAATLLDPVRGRSRRARLRDQAAARLRDAADHARKQVRYQSGKLKGAIIEATTSEDAPRTDAELLQKVRSEAVGGTPGSLAHIDLRVEDGIVHLTGVSRDAAQERELIDRIAEVTGVVGIHSELTPA